MKTRTEFFAFSAAPFVLKVLVFMPLYAFGWIASPQLFFVVGSTLLVLLIGYTWAHLGQRLRKSRAETPVTYRQDSHFRTCQL